MQKKVNFNSITVAFNTVAFNTVAFNFKARFA